MVFGGKQRAVEALVATYVERARECVQRFVEGMDLWLTGGEATSSTLSRAHEAESQADDVRRELCLLLYGKALFPESRGDILGLVEAVDKVPNRAEAIIRRLKSEHICPPVPALADGFRKLVGRVHECTRVMFDAVTTLFEDYHAAVVLSDRVDHLESQVDVMEMELIERIFQSDLDRFDKVMYREVVKDVGGLADRAENASDRIRIIAVKRKV